jgi:hypothetical protein
LTSHAPVTTRSDGRNSSTAAAKTANAASGVAQAKLANAQETVSGAKQKIDA